MKNKKSMISMDTMIYAALLIIFLFAMIAGAYTIFYHKQIPWLSGQTDYVTKDCDRDGVTGITDPCPCVFSIPNTQTLEKNQVCPGQDPEATKECPELCKGQIASAKKTGTSQG